MGGMGISIWVDVLIATAAFVVVAGVTALIVRARSVSGPALAEASQALEAILDAVTQPQPSPLLPAAAASAEALAACATRLDDPVFARAVQSVQRAAEDDDRAGVFAAARRGLTRLEQLQRRRLRPD